MSSLFSVVKELLVQDEEEQLALYAETVLYLSGALSAFDYQNIIRHSCTQRSPKVFRLSLLTDKYKLVNIKLYLFALLKEKEPAANTLKKLAAEFCIYPSDSKRISALVTNCSWFKREARRVLRGISKTNTMLTMVGIDRIFQQVYEPVYKYAKALAYKKLRFIAKSNNYEIADLAEDIMEKVVQSFYLLVPTDQPVEYVQNYLKRSAHNRAINLIKTHTTQKNGRIVSVSEVHGMREFSLLCVSGNQGAINPEAPTLDVDHGDDGKAVAEFETRFSVSEILTKHQRSERKYQFLIILMGEPDSDFTSWLQQNGYCKQDEDNTDVQMKTGVEEFNKLIARYMEVRYEHIRNFIDSLRPELCEA